MLKLFVRTALAAAVVIAAGTLSQPPLAQEKSLTIFAAASMKNALDDVNAAFTKKTSIKTVASYAATSALMRQIEQGAPADIFASADLEWMDYGLKNKLINPDTRVNLLGNRLVLIAPKDSKITTVKLEKGFDLAKLVGDGRIATGEVKSVPVGRYAVAALQKLGMWAVGREAHGHGRERARGAYAGRPRRGRARHRLRDRRQGRAGRQDRRALPARLASRDRLSGRRDRQSRTPKRRATSTSCSRERRSRSSRSTASASW